MFGVVNFSNLFSELLKRFFVPLLSFHYKALIFFRASWFFGLEMLKVPWCNCEDYSWAVYCAIIALLKGNLHNLKCFCCLFFIPSISMHVRYHSLRGLAGVAILKRHWSSFEKEFCINKHIGKILKIKNYQNIFEFIFFTK